MRLAIPFMLGIYVASKCSIGINNWFLLLIFFMLLVVTGMLSERIRLFFGFGVIGMMFVLGGIVEQKDALTISPRWNEDKGEYSAVFIETPRMGDKTVKALAMLTKENGDTMLGRQRGIVYLYLANCVDAEDLQIGERIIFTAKVRNPKNAGNPAEFDYERYLYIKGVTGSVYLPVGGWRKDGRDGKTLFMHALSLREKIVNYYSRLPFENDEKAVLSALTIGDKSELTREIKELYSSVGISHILAISGLHLGIFYMILTIFLPVWRTKRSYTVFREFVIVGVMWLFAFVAGLSPSIVRAAILFTFFSLGKCLRRDASSLNSLSFAAIVILLFSPRSLFDVSFQLSFAAVLSILLFLPNVRKFFRCDKYGRLYGYIVDIVAVSFVAQVGTLPFVWYYFGKFPIYFLIANVMIVPLAFIVMLFAVFLWATVPIVALNQGIAWLLNRVVLGINKISDFVNDLPYASVELPYIDVVATCGIVACLFLFFYCLNSKNRLLPVFVFAVVLLSVCIYMFTERQVHKDYILFYNSKNCVAVQFVVSRDTSYLFSTVEQSDAELDYITYSYWKRESFANPVWINGDYHDVKFNCHDDFIVFGDKRIKFLNDNSWQNDSVSQSVDLLFLGKGFTGPMEEILSKYTANRVVMDAGLHYMSRRRVMKECDMMGVFCIDISRVGAVSFLCDDKKFQPIYLGKQ